MNTNQLTEIHHVAIRVPNPAETACRLGRHGLQFSAREVRPDFVLLQFANVFLALVAEGGRLPSHVGVAGLPVNPMIRPHEHSDGSAGYYEACGGVMLEVLTKVPDSVSLHPSTQKKITLDIRSIGAGHVGFDLRVDGDYFAGANTSDDGDFEERLSAARELVQRAGGVIKDNR